MPQSNIDLTVISEFTRVLSDADRLIGNQTPSGQAAAEAARLAVSQILPLAKANLLAASEAGDPFHTEQLASLAQSQIIWLSSTLSAMTSSGLIRDEAFNASLIGLSRAAAQVTGAALVSQAVEEVLFH